MSEQLDNQLKVSKLSELTNCGDFNDYVRARRIPILGQIELTHRCNLHCPHCYTVYQPSKKELDYKEVCNILDDIAKEGCLWLLLSGGEPLLREDFPDIYRYVKKKGIIAYIETNVTLMTPKIAKMLHDILPAMVIVSLYGITERTYESITHVAGSFQQCMEGIRLLQEYSIPYRLRTPVLSMNQSEIANIASFADGLGVPYSTAPRLFPKQNGSRKPYDFSVSISNVTTPYEESALSVNPCNGGSPVPNTPKKCRHGINSFYINAYGELLLCVIFWASKYNLRQGSFHDAWHNWMPKFRPRFPWIETCLAADIFSSDGQCPGWEFLENKNNDLSIPLEQHVVNFVENSKLSRKKAIKRLGLPESVYYEWLNQHGRDR